jgi:hypothetical protein
MLLVPKQLRRAGMTGNVPYYGGRFSPAQAYAAAHPSGGRPATVPPVAGTAAPAEPASRAGSQTQALAALQYLLDTGVITASEYEDVRARVVG